MLFHCKCVKMKTSSFVTLSVIVAIGYLFSYVHSSPTPTDSTPTLGVFEDLVSRSDKSTLEYLADKGRYSLF